MTGFVGARRRAGVLPRVGGRDAWHRPGDPAPTRWRATGAEAGTSPAEPSGGRYDRADVEGEAVERPLHLRRRGVRGAGVTRSGRSQPRVGYVLIGILVAFLLGLFSLTQTVRVSAIDRNLGALLDARAHLEATRRELNANLAQMAGESVVVRRARDAGLVQLVEPFVVPAN